MLKLSALAGVASLVAALAIAGCGDDASTASSEVESFIPPDSPLYMELETDLNSEQATQLFDLIEGLGDLPVIGSVVDPRELLADEFNTAAEEEGVDLSFDADVAPLLGGTLAIAGFASDESFDNTIAALETEDGAVAEETIRRLITADGTELEEFEVGGGTFMRMPEEDQGGVGIVDDTIVFGSTDAMLEDAMAAHDGDSLGSSGEIDDALGGLTEDRLGAAYVDLGYFTEQAAAEDGSDSSDVEAAKALFGGILDEPLGLAVTAQDNGLAVDVSSGGVLGLPTEGTEELLSEAPADAVAALALGNIGDQADDVIERLEPLIDEQLESSGEPMTIDEVSELALGVPLDDATAAFGDALVFVQGGLPAPYTGGIRVDVENEEVADTLVAYLRFGLGSDPGIVLEDPPSGGEGFTAHYRGDVAEGEPDMISVELADGQLTVLVSSGDAVAGGEGGFTDSELFAVGADALGDFEPVAVADLDSFLGAFLGDSSVVDVVTGELSGDSAIPAFIAEQLHVAAIGGSSDGDRAIHRIAVTVDE